MNSDDPPRHPALPPAAISSPCAMATCHTQPNAPDHVYRQFVTRRQRRRLTWFVRALRWVQRVNRAGIRKVTRRLIYVNPNPQLVNAVRAHLALNRMDVDPPSPPSTPRRLHWGQDTQVFFRSSDPPSAVCASHRLPPPPGAPGTSTDAASAMTYMAALVRSTHRPHVLPLPGHLEQVLPTPSPPPPSIPPATAPPTTPGAPPMSRYPPGFGPDDPLPPSSLRPSPPHSSAHTRMQQPHGARGRRHHHTQQPTCLKVLTHNVSGLFTPGPIHGLVRTWVAHNADIICLQETWIGRPNGVGPPATEQQVAMWLHDATSQLQAPSYVVFWAHHVPVATGPPIDGNNGLAILVKLSLAASCCDHSPHPSGRMQTLRINWGGHDFHLVNTYWPCASPPQRATFMTTILAPVLNRCPTLVVLGDFNFTPDPPLDRDPVMPSTTAADVSTQRLWQSTAPQLIDVFRLHHPAQRAPTFLRQYQQAPQSARLDRVYTIQALAQHSQACTVLPGTRGHHMPVMWLLRSTAPLQQRGPGRKSLPNQLLCSDPPCIVSWVYEYVQLGMSLDDHGVLYFVPKFLAGLFDRAAKLYRQLRGATPTTTPNVQRIEQSLQHILTAFSTAPPAHRSSLLHQAVAISSDLRNAVAADAAGAAARHRTRWLQNNEQPSPAITHLLRAQQGVSTIPALTTTQGVQLTDNRDIADAMAQHYAAISGQVEVDIEAQAQVLAALQRHLQSRQLQLLPHDLAAAAGAATITPEEVHQALANAPDSSAPGFDGVPYSFLKVGNLCMVPLLARFYSSIGSHGLTPPGFTRGTITPLLKPDASDAQRPVAFRPITLLLCVYRVLTKVLAARFGAAMAPAIGVEQSAYLPGRYIGDAINFTDLVPHAMRALNINGAFIFLDISKAFDTVHREFMYQIMTAMGASTGMVAWARLLLTDTWASVHANGVESGVHQWHAGVRQGCPLSPLLYLFVAQALSSWIWDHANLGTTVDGHRSAAIPFADDTTLVQHDLSDATMNTLATALLVYKAATGQAINLAKCLVLLIGALRQQHMRAGIRVSDATIPVRDAVTSLGLPRTNPPPPARAPTHTYNTRAALRPIPQDPPPLPLAIQQAWASRLAAASNTLHRIMALPLSEIGRGQAASSYAISTFLYHAEFSGMPPHLPQIITELRRAVAPGVPWCILTASPKEGGFGVLPVNQHIQARHAAWAVRLVHHLLQPPSPTTPHWVHVARFLLTSSCPTLHPAQFLLSATTATASDVARGIFLPPSAAVPQLSAVPASCLTNMALALNALGPLYAAPISPHPLHQPHLPAADVQALLAPASWSVHSAPSVAAHASVPPTSLTTPVRTFTTMLTHSLRLQRTELHNRFLHQALGRPSNARDASALLATFQSVHQSISSGHLKSVYFRLAANAIPGAAIRPWTCPCATQPLPNAHQQARQHSFWDCPIATAIRHDIATALHISPSLLTQPDLWLMRPPTHTSISPDLWTATCLAALDAMEYGRASLWKHHILLQSPHRPPRPHRPLLDIPIPQAAPIAQALPIISAATISRLWCNLQDYITDNGLSPDTLHYDLRQRFQQYSPQHLSDA